MKILFSTLQLLPSEDGSGEEVPIWLVLPNDAIFSFFSLPLEDAIAQSFHRMVFYNAKTIDLIDKDLRFQIHEYPDEIQSDEMKTAITTADGLIPQIGFKTIYLQDLYTDDEVQPIEVEAEQISYKIERDNTFYISLNPSKKVATLNFTFDLNTLTTRHPRKRSRTASSAATANTESDWLDIITKPTRLNQADSETLLKLAAVLSHFSLSVQDAKRIAETETTAPPALPVKYLLKCELHAKHPSYAEPATSPDDAAARLNPEIRAILTAGIKTLKRRLPDAYKDKRLTPGYLSVLLSYNTARIKYPRITNPSSYLSKDYPLFYSTTIRSLFQVIHNDQLDLLLRFYKLIEKIPILANAYWLPVRDLARLRKTTFTNRKTTKRPRKTKHENKQATNLLYHLRNLDESDFNTFRQTLNLLNAHPILFYLNQYKTHNHESYIHDFQERHQHFARFATSIRNGEEPSKDRQIELFWKNVIVFVFNHPALFKEEDDIINILKLYLPSSPVQSARLTDRSDQLKITLPTLTTEQITALRRFLWIRRNCNFEITITSAKLLELLRSASPRDTSTFSRQTMASFIQQLPEDEYHFTHTAMQLIRQHPELMDAKDDHFGLFLPQPFVTPFFHKSPLTPDELTQLLTIFDSLSDRQKQALFVLREIETRHPTLVYLVDEYTSFIKPRPAGDNYDEHPPLPEFELESDFYLEPLPFETQTPQLTAQSPATAIQTLDVGDLGAFCKGKQLESEHPLLVRVRTFEHYINPQAHYALNEELLSIWLKKFFTVNTTFRAQQMLSLLDLATILQHYSITIDEVIQIITSAPYTGWYPKDDLLLSLRLQEMPLHPTPSIENITQQLAPATLHRLRDAIMLFHPILILRLRQQGACIANKLLISYPKIVTDFTVRPQGIGNYPFYYKAIDSLLEVIRANKMDVLTWFYQAKRKHPFLSNACWLPVAELQTLRETYRPTPLEGSLGATAVSLDDGEFKKLCEAVELIRQYPILPLLEEYTDPAPETYFKITKSDFQVFIDVYNGKRSDMPNHLLAYFHAIINTIIHRPQYFLVPQHCVTMIKLHTETDSPPPKPDETTQVKLLTTLTTLSKVQRRFLTYFISLREKHKSLYHLPSYNSTFRIIQGGRYHHSNPISIAHVLESLSPDDFSRVCTALALITSHPELVYANTAQTALLSRTEACYGRYNFPALQRRSEARFLYSNLTPHPIDILEALEKRNPKDIGVLLALRKLERKYPVLTMLTYRQLCHTKPRPPGEYREETTETVSNRGNTNFPLEVILQLSDNELRILHDGKKIEHEQPILRQVGAFESYINPRANNTPNEKLLEIWTERFFRNNTVFLPRHMQALLDLCTILKYYSINIDTAITIADQATSTTPYQHNSLPLLKLLAKPHQPTGEPSADDVKQQLPAEIHEILVATIKLQQSFPIIIKRLKQIGPRLSSLLLLYCPISLPQPTTTPEKAEDFFPQIKAMLESLNADEKKSLAEFIQVREKYTLLYNLTPGDRNDARPSPRNLSCLPHHLTEQLGLLSSDSFRTVRAYCGLLSKYPTLMYINKTILVLYVPFLGSLPERYNYQALRMKSSVWYSAATPSPKDILNILETLSPSDKKALFTLRQIETRHPVLAMLNYEHLQLSKARPAGQYQKEAIVNIDEADNHHSSTQIPNEVILQLSDHELRALYDGKKLEQEHPDLKKVKLFGEYIPVDEPDADTTTSPTSEAESSSVVDLTAPPAPPSPRFFPEPPQPGSPTIVKQEVTEAIDLTASHDRP